MDQVAMTFDHAAASYEQQLQQGLAVSGESADFFVRGRVCLLERLLQRQQVSCQSVLDFGCGVGNATKTLQSCFPMQQLVGLDCSVESIQVARRRHGEDRCRWLTDPKQIEMCSLDLAYTSGVFHHIAPDERDTHLAHIYSWLKPGGWFAFFENNPWNPATRYVMSRIPFDRDAQCLSLFEAKRRLTDAGFAIRTVRTLFYFPRPLQALRSWERWLQFLPLGAQYLILCRRPGER